MVFFSAIDVGGECEGDNIIVEIVSSPKELLINYKAITYDKEFLGSHTENILILGFVKFFLEGKKCREGGIIALHLDPSKKSSMLKDQEQTQNLSLMI